jgi:hypothetical protein
MNKSINSGRSLDAYLGCFGNFVMEDPICKGKCALRLRCAIERDQNTRLELMEEMVASAEGPSAIVH